MSSGFVKNLKEMFQDFTWRLLTLNQKYANIKMFFIGGQL